MAIYLIKINLALIVLFGFYKLIAANDTFFAWRRTALLSIYLAALAIPALNLSYWIEESNEIHSMANAYATNVLPAFTIEAEQTASIGWTDVFEMIYIGVWTLLFLRFVGQILTIIRLKKRCKAMNINGVRVYDMKEEDCPFSFFGWIFINTEKHNRQELNEIISHEQTHSQQWHSVDVVFAELFGICFWINPFVWLLKKEICLNLEFLADNQVIKGGTDSKAYQYHLLRLTYRKKVATISNNFNVSPLKKRIKMMNKKPTKGIGKAKYAFFLPLTAALLLVSNIETVARTLMNTTEKYAPELSKTIKKAVKATAIPELVEIVETQKTETPMLPATEATEEEATEVATAMEQPSENMAETTDDDKKKKQQVFEVADEMPTFNGNLMGWLYENIKYPKEAAKANIQGRVIIKFVVSETGEVTDPQIIRSVHPSIDQEAIRVVKAMPRWNPGKQDGKPVKVRYTLPIAFKTSSGNSAKSADTSATPTQKTGINPAALKNVYVVVDGKEVTDLNSINPESIESMNVLKGKEATARYGEKAADGAIEIKLKK